MNANLKYFKYTDKIKNKEDIEKHPIFNLTMILMMSTGVYRLYTREDFLTFFKRLALLGNHYNFIDNFYLNGELFNFYFHGKEYTATAPDFGEMTGIVFGPGYTVYVEEEKWVSKLPKMIKNANLAGVFMNTFVFTKDIKIEGSDTSIDFEFNENIPLLKDVDLKNAEILASSLLKEIPDDIFKQWETSFPMAEEDFNNEVARISKIKQFDYQGLPDEVKKAIQEHFEQFFEKEEWNEDFVMKLTHLAWAYANDYIYTDHTTLHSVEAFINFDETGLELEDGGINLEETFSLFSLNDLWDVLKGRQ